MKFMKATLSFDLNDQDDRIAHLQAIKAQEMAIALWEIWHNTIRSVERNVESGTITDPHEVVDQFRENIGDLLQASGINVDSLVN